MCQWGQTFLAHCNFRGGKMRSKEEIQKMRKTNMKIFPTYKKLAWDYLFFYTIDFLFLTQIKGISGADVVLKSKFYAFFSIILQIPANIIVEFLGRYYFRKYFKLLLYRNYYAK